MEKVQLDVKKRTKFGKGACRDLRREDQIPGVVYKGGEDAVSVQVDKNDLWHALHTEAGENAIITMNISDEDSGSRMEKTVILKEIQVDPINNDFVHFDFHEISLKEKLQVKIPIVSKGEAAGVKEENGVLTQTLWELEIECLPTDIPDNIEVKVDDLMIGDAILVRDLDLPEGIDVLEDEEHPVVSVNPPEEFEEEEEEIPGEEEAEEPEVIKKGKKEEEEIPEEGPAEEAEAGGEEG